MAPDVNANEGPQSTVYFAVGVGWTLRRPHVKVCDLSMTSKLGQVPCRRQTYVFPPGFGRVSERAIPPGSPQPPPIATIISPMWPVSARIAQACHPPSCFKEYLVRRMPPGKSNEKPPAALKHAAGQSDQPKAYRLHTAIHPALSQNLAPHGRIEVERKNHDLPPGGISPKQS